ncbi:MAG: outer membrane protein assembly factor BamA [Gammaproteobacteria bacterium]|nr:outer membrane protein assembly factor BamA [Gammaproteobacteria bacterium]
MKRLKTLGVIAILLISCSALASNFTIKSIRVNGLHRISYKTFLNYLPVKTGDRANTSTSTKIIRKLYNTGFFDNVAVYRQYNNIIITVKERPVISSIKIAGNDKIKTKDLLKALHKIGFREGSIFNHSILKELKQALIQQYHNMGLYDVNIAANAKQLSKDRIAVDITIREGVAAKIRSIKILGNRHFSNRTLLKNFSLTTPSLWSWFTNSDQYSKLKLAMDLQNLKNYYLDHGYLKCNIDSTQVSITPDRRFVYITIHISEGHLYKVSNVTLSGNLLGKKQDLLKLVTIKNGELFSRQKIVDTDNALSDFFGDIGYAFLQITPRPIPDDRNHTVAIDFHFIPGKPVYVHNIYFVGNKKTADYVLRREMRQMEGAIYSLPKIKESTRRLNMLGYLKNIHTSLKPAPNRPNQVDLKYNVTETSSTKLMGQIGYSDAEGFLYGASISDQNFLGTGDSAGLQFNNSSLSKTYSFNFFNPYITDNQVSLGVNAYLQKTTPNQIDLSSYSTNTYGVKTTIGYPISEYSIINYGLGFDHTNLKVNAASSTQAKTFVNKYGHLFDDAKLSTSWQYTNMDKAIYPTRGLSNDIELAVAAPLINHKMPGGGHYPKIYYYKITDEALFYHPIIKDFIFEAHALLGYGDAFNKSQSLPFYENFFSGGIGSVRGFEAGTIGPKDSNGNAIGAHAQAEGSIGIIFPNPFGETVRTTAFVDAGSVYDNTKNIGRDISDLRVSSGLQVEWRTPLAPLVFSLAAPLRKKTGDSLSFFQFSLGTSF